MSDVFISYSRKDQEFVHKLNDALKVSDRESWVDWEQIRIAEDWWRKIQEAIAATDTFVFVITSDSLASSVCRDEVDYASSLNKRIVPILRKDISKDLIATMHPALARHNWLYFRESDDFDKVFEDLLEAIDTDPVHTKEHTRLLIRAIEWEKEKINDSLLRGEDLKRVEKWLTLLESEVKEPKLTDLQITYIDNSRKIEDARQRANRMSMGGLIILGMSLIAALGVWVWTARKVTDANGKIELANVLIKTLDARGDFQEDRIFDALLKAVSAGKKLKALDTDIVTNNENNIEIAVASTFSQILYIGLWTRLKQKKDRFKAKRDNESFKQKQIIIPKPLCQ